MKAIVIVFIPRPDGQLVTEQVAAACGPDILRHGPDPDKATTEPRRTFSRNQTPPFWTWFIENPRSCGA